MLTVVLLTTILAGSPTFDSKNGTADNKSARKAVVFIGCNEVPWMVNWIQLDGPGAAVVVVVAVVGAVVVGASSPVKNCEGDASEARYVLYAVFAVPWKKTSCRAVANANDVDGAAPTEN